MTALLRWFRRKPAGGSRHDPGPDDVHGAFPIPPPGSFPHGNNEFALGIYQQLREATGNLCFSPFSLRVALAMTWAGAGEATEMQMREALRLSAMAEEEHGRFDEASRRLQTGRGGTRGLVLVNALWGQTGLSFSPEYVCTITKRYAGGLSLVDFRENPESVRDGINRWAREQTGGRIEELCPPGSLGTLTGLVLANATHFRELWAAPFDETDTREEPFHLGGGGEVRVPLMSQEGQFPYVEDSRCKAVALPYEGTDLWMLLILPRKKRRLGRMERKLSAGTLANLLSRMEPRWVKLAVPRFEMAWGGANLRPTLEALGMKLPFDGRRADFSGMNGHRPPSLEALFLSHVLHRAWIEVGEGGTEASAATLASMEVGATPASHGKPICTFRADRPFLFAILEGETGMILFMGRVADPGLTN